MNYNKGQVVKYIFGDTYYMIYATKEEPHVADYPGSLPYGQTQIDVPDNFDYLILRLERIDNNGPYWLGPINVMERDLSEVTSLEFERYIEIEKNKIQ